LHFPVVFLENEDGIPVHPSLLNRGPVQPHDHGNINEAQRVAVTVDPAPMGLLYQNTEVPAYEEIRWQRKARPDHEAFLQRLDAAMDVHTVS
jgi:hypothetical protein